MLCECVAVGTPVYGIPTAIGDNGVYLLKVTSVNISEEKDIDMEKNRLDNSKRARVNFESFEALKEQANIKDNRYKFF